MTATCHHGKPPGAPGPKAANDASSRCRSGNTSAIWLRTEELASGKNPPEMTSRARKTRLTTAGAASKFGMNGCSVSTQRGSRAAQIGDAAIAILAERGARGLTHRAVDSAAGLPPGTTSNYARTRAALVELALERMTELETADIAPRMAAGPPASLDEFASLAAGIIHHSITAARTRMLARYELALEATRRPELRAVYDQAGQLYREGAPALLAAAGSADPERHARMLTAWAEGIMFDAIAGAGWQRQPTVEDLRLTLLEYLRAILPATGQETGS